MAINNEYDIGKAFETIENELIASMMRNFKRHKFEEIKESKQWSMWQTEMLHTLEKYKKQNSKKYREQFRNINSEIASLISAANSDGQMQQEKAILEAIRKGFRGHRVARGAQAEFFKLNERKLEALIKATMDDMKKAETAVLRMANDQYRKIIYNAQVYANTGAGTYEQAVDIATHDFLSAGLNCIEYKNGARHTLADYADMAIRTASKRAYLQGEGVKRQEWGIHTVIVNKRGNPCPKCLPFVGKVLIDDVWSGGTGAEASESGYGLMSSAISAGLYHPRCKDSHTTYFPGISTPPDDKFSRNELKKIEKQNRKEAKEQYAERQEEKFERLEKHSLDMKNKEQYAIKKESWKEQAYRAVEKGEKSTILINQFQKTEININKIETYPGEIYVSDLAAIKPRALNTINQRTEQALKQWKIELSRKPKIVIVSPEEMPTAYGKYDAIQNAVFYLPQIVDSKVVKDQGNIEFHEMWHMKQAENFRAKYGEITEENYGKYIKNSCKEAKKTVDSAGINEYNVSEISKYAKEMYDFGRYDEVEAEYMTLHRRR